MRIFLLLLTMLATPCFAELRVVDGDTLELDGITYRLNGIDAPEHGQTCGSWACGADATIALVKLVEGRDVVCDRKSDDSYGRTIATCYADGKDIGAELVDKGFAWAFLRYSDVYEHQELNAKAQEFGVWSDRYQTPWEFRAAQWSAALVNEDDAPPGCPIKGNISANGRIYHAPWSPWYARTRINPAKGERWFCTEAEALTEGWSAPHWN